MGRLIAIGDVHGQYTKLRNLIDKLELTGKDDVFLLGDLVDQGPQSADVIEYVMHMRKYYKVWPIMGNHDSWFLDYLESGNAEPAWLEQGGQETLDSYGPSHEVPKAHQEFLRLMMSPITVETALEGVTYILSHGMLSPTHEVTKRFADWDALWGRPSSFRLGNKGWVWKKGVYNIFGHTPHRAPTWYYEEDGHILGRTEQRGGERALCIDTNAKHADNPLTAVILPVSQWGKVEFLQSDGTEEPECTT